MNLAPYTNEKMGNCLFQVYLFLSIFHVYNNVTHCWVKKGVDYLKYCMITAYKRI